MKLSISEIDRRFKAAAEAEAQLDSVKSEAEAEKQRLQAEMNNAAEAGDLERYKILKQQIGGIDDELFVKVAQLKKAAKGPSDEDVFAAWGAYAAEHNSKLAVLLANLEKRKNELLDAFEAAVDFQAEALTIRERLAGYIGAEPNRFGMDFIPTENDVQRLPVNDILCKFYVHNRWDRSQIGAIYDPRSCRIGAVVERHASK